MSILLRVLFASLIIVSLSCGKKNREDELREMQRKADSVNRNNAQDEKLKKLDSLAGALDSMKNELEAMEKDSDSMKKKLDSIK